MIILELIPKTIGSCLLTGNSSYDRPSTLRQSQQVHDNSLPFSSNESAADDNDCARNYLSNHSALRWIPLRVLHRWLRRSICAEPDRPLRSSAVNCIHLFACPTTLRSMQKTSCRLAFLLSKSPSNHLRLLLIRSQAPPVRKPRGSPTRRVPQT